MASSPDYEERIREFEKRYALNPGSLVFAQLADLYRKSGEPDRALEILEEGLAEHPDYLSAHIVRGRSYRDMGDTAAAVESFSRVLELDGENLVALRSLGELARERGDPAEAKRWYERLLQVDPLNEEVQEILKEMSPGGGPDAPSTAGEEVGPDPAGGSQPGERAGSGAVGEGDPSLQAGATFDLDGGNAAPGEPVEPEEPVEAEDPLEPEDPGEAGSLDQPLTGDVEEPFRPDPEAAEGGPAAGGIGEEPQPEPPREPGEPEETVESSSGGSADEAVNRAFDAVESWRRETAEAEAADEERALDEEGALEEERADEEGAAEDRTPAAGAPDEDEEALAAAWEEAYPEEPSTPAESDDMGFAPEADDLEEEPAMGVADEAAGGEESTASPESDDPGFTPESEEVEEEPAAGVPADEAAPGEEPAAGVPMDEDPPGEEPAFGAAAERDRDPSDDEVFTETLAGLYARQGFYTEAVEIYEELLRRRPDDETLRERLEAARESRDRTGERLTAEAPTDAPTEIPEEEPARRRDEPSATPIESGGEVPEDGGSIGEHLRALLRGEAPVGFSAGAPAEDV